MDPEILLLRRQYLQLFEPDFLAWPPKQLLRDPDIQEWIYHNLFDSNQNTYLPPERYQYRVLKRLLAKIEQAIEDPEEDVGRFCFYYYLLKLLNAFAQATVAFRIFSDSASVLHRKSQTIL